MLLKKILMSPILFFIFNLQKKCAFCGSNVVPPARLDAFEDGGFKVSIPDVPGISLFAFHGNLNKPLDNLEAGEFSMDILKKDAETGRWTYTNKVTKLKRGDVINYWTYIIVERLGYSRTNERFTVYEFADESQNRTSRNCLKLPPPTFEAPTTTSSNCGSKKESPLETCMKMVSTTVDCLTKVQEQLTQLQADYNEIKQGQITSQHETTTLVPTTTTATPDTSEIKYALVLGGNLPRVAPDNKADTLHLVNFIVWEKLDLEELEAKEARRNKDGTITFGMFNENEKQVVLNVVKRKLINSTIYIRDANSS